MLNFYDFEVFKEDWLVVIINPILKEKNVIVNDRDSLRYYFNQHKNEIWIGYNSRNYDQYILKGLLIGINPKKINDYIINDGMKGWQIDPKFREINVNNYDVSKMEGLKVLEGFMGNDIRETSVPFDIQRKLTDDELQEVIKYCTHDVEQTMEVFLRRGDDFNAQMDLIKTFNLPLNMISLTQQQLTANILGCRKYGDRIDEFDLQIVDCLKIEKYKHVVEWFKDKSNHNYNKKLKTDVCGIPHIFGWGGLHGCVENPIHRKGFLIHVDVTSFYPSIMIEYDFLTRNCRDKSKYKQIYDKRVELKKAGKKKEQAPYKIVLNGTYGICKDKYSSAYDPRQANNVCVNGQLLLLDLLEHLEPYCEVIQSNTDGLIIQIEDTDEAYNKIDDVCYEWEQRTKMSLGFDLVTEIWQKDVNNYIFRFDNGKLERKGAYVKELNDLDYDLPIVNEAIVKYLTENILPEKTINDCDELKKFQKIIKLSNKYMFAWHNKEKLTEKTFRVFASKDYHDSYIGKQKMYGATIEKFANTPMNCFIDNSDINKKEVPLKLDKQWYIDLAIKRIEDYGFNATKYKQMELF